MSEDQGKPISDAVVYAVPVDGVPPPSAPANAVIDLVNKMYTPFVTAIRAGTVVRFPNSDNIKHNLYSVSPIKRFERPLYREKEAEPVVFDKAGEATLGCNIHDWMIAHVLVLETPYTNRP